MAGWTRRWLRVFLSVMRADRQPAAPVAHWRDARPIYDRLIGAILLSPLVALLGLVARLVVAAASARSGHCETVPASVDAAAGGIAALFLGPRVSRGIRVGTGGWLLPVLPPVSLALFYGYVLLVRIHLGHWPAYNDADPGWLPVLQVSVDSALVFALFSPALLLFLAPSLLQPGREGARSRALTGAFLVGYAGWLAILRVDAGGFLEWFMD